MILGIGSDLANIERIQGTLDRFGTRFKTVRFAVCVLSNYALNIAQDGL